MKNVKTMTHHELELKLGFNGVHFEDKDLMDTDTLRQLAVAKYVDVSWGNDECASFMSPCGHFQIFYSAEDDTAIYAQHICDDGEVTPVRETNSMMEALCAIRTHKPHGA